MAKPRHKIEDYEQTPSLPISRHDAEALLYDAGFKPYRKPNTIKGSRNIGSTIIFRLCDPDGQEIQFSLDCHAPSLTPGARSAFIKVVKEGYAIKSQARADDETPDMPNAPVFFFKESPHSR